MQINQISNNPISMSAKLSTYPRTITNKDVFDKFEEKTKDFPNLKLLQDDISFFKDGHFFLLENDKVLNFKTASFTNNRTHYDTIDKIVDRFVDIFKTLQQKKS